MNRERISAFNMVAIQSVILIYILMIITFLFRIYLRVGFSGKADVILLGIIIIIIILTKTIYKCFDVYLLEDYIMVKKLFKKRVMLISEISSVEHAVFPFYYVIKFKDARKVYFRIRTNELVMELTKPREEGLLLDLKKKFHLK